MISLIKPILITFASSDAVKVLVIEILEALVSKSENKLDDKAVALIRDALGV